VGADGADLRLGGGDDSISLRITAEKHVVRVHATSADAALADALRASADELRQALGAHGLELAELSASTAGGGGTPSGQGGGASDLPGGNDGDAAPTASRKETRPDRKRGWVA
jgi:hypothetical protein